MKIGQAAARSGVSAKMIRHYESIGLIAADRGANGYRVYGDRDVAVLRFIRHARDLGFPLDDVRRLLALWRDRGRASADVKRLALAHVAALDSKAESLRRMADSLRHLAAHCHGDARPDCPILDDLAGKDCIMTKTEGPTITLSVTGMTCGHCVKAVTAAIQAKDPDAKVAVDLADGTVKAETVLPRHVVTMAVEEEGYAVKA